MSSEKRSIRPCAFERDVPPLKTKDFPNRDSWKRNFRATQTQKSFSMIVGLIPRPPAASLKTSRRSSGGRRASLSIRALFSDFLNGGIDPAGRRLRIEEYPLPQGRIELPANVGNDLGRDAIFAKCFQRMDDEATFGQLESGLLEGRVLKVELGAAHSV